MILLTDRVLTCCVIAQTLPQNQTDHVMRNTPAVNAWKQYILFFINLSHYYGWRNVSSFTSKWSSTSLIHSQHEHCVVIVWNTCLRVHILCHRMKKNAPSTPPLLLILYFLEFLKASQDFCWVIVQHGLCLVIKVLNFGTICFVVFNSWDCWIWCWGWKSLRATRQIWWERCVI